MKDMNVEQALARLEEIVTQLESEEVDLDRSLELFSEGVRLSGICRKKLDRAEQIVEERKRELKEYPEG